MVNIENELFEDIVATPLQLNQALPLGCKFAPFMLPSASVSDVQVAAIILIEGE